MYTQLQRRRHTYAFMQYLSYSRYKFSDHPVRVPCIHLPLKYIIISHRRMVRVYYNIIETYYIDVHVVSVRQTHWEYFLVVIFQILERFSV